MKKNKGKYPVVDRLPARAMTVAAYCDTKGYTTSNLYNQSRKGRLDKCRIVIFQGYNFVIPE